MKRQNPKRTHEIRDPIHTFIRVDNRERSLIDSAVFQRLRHIHQLALTYLLYPGATHRRFEHSLGVMELAGRVFDVVTDPQNIHFDSVASIVPDEGDLEYWRRVIRMAALCHDIGHLPFSHAAERELLPKGLDHERLTVALIKSDLLKSIWEEGPPINSDHVAKIAVGKRKLREVEFSTWEAILSEIITGDSFGVDRMDYLLRDSHHLGVAYGRFDHHRLIDTLRILPQSTEEGGSSEPALGVEIGGLHVAESLLMARYFIYEQVYFHPIRRIYDIHLKEFMLAYFGGPKYPTDVDGHLNTTDNEILSAIAAASRNASLNGHSAAVCIANRLHFKKIYQRNPADLARRLDAAKILYAALGGEFNPSLLRFDQYKQETNPYEFPVLSDSGRIDSSVAVSDILKNLPTTAVEYIFADRSISNGVERWFATNRASVLNEEEK